MTGGPGDAEGGRCYPNAAARAGESVGGKCRGRAFCARSYTWRDNRRWVRRFNAPVDDSYACTTAWQYDCPLIGTAVDRNGNSYLAGHTWSDPGLQDILIRSYGRSGKLRWTHRYNGKGNSWDEVNAVAMDGNDNFIITGSTHRGGGDYGFVTMRLSPEGGFKWRRHFSRGGFDEALDVVIGQNNAVFITGRSENDSMWSTGIVTIKYSGGGIRRWARRYNAGVFTLPFGIAADNRNGSLFVGGASTDAKSGIMTIKYKQ